MVSHVTVVDLDAPAPLQAGQDTRITDAALRCIARWGLAKTTVDDIAKEAGYSRATVYRCFPGGKDAVIAAAARREVARFCTGLAAVLDSAESLEDLVVAGVTEAARHIREHAALQYLLAHEPGVILPRISFHKMNEVLATASGAVAPYLERFVGPPTDALRAAEWITRIVVSYTFSPTATVDTGSEESVRGLVRAFVLPGLVNPVTV